MHLKSKLLLYLVVDSIQNKRAGLTATSVPFGSLGTYCEASVSKSVLLHPTLRTNLIVTVATFVGHGCQYYSKLFQLLIYSQLFRCFFWFHSFQLFQICIKTSGAGVTDDVSAAVKSLINYGGKTVIIATNLYTCPRKSYF